ncbi:MAG: cation transporter [Rhodothermus sp.]|nr:cation transporter [Rhodothermus sp.]
MTRRHPNARKTFGYRRAETLEVFVNLATLVVIAPFLIKEAINLAL